MASFPSNYVTCAHLQERWLKERDQKMKTEQEDLGGERPTEGETEGSRERVEGANKVPSFPSNYVTVAHLQERWLKEREQKKKEQDDLEQERKRLDDLAAAAEIQRKKEVEELERERKRAEDQAAAEILRRKEEEDRERADDSTVANVQSRSDGEEERKKNKKKKGKKKQKGTYGFVEEEKNGLSQIEEVEPKFFSFSVIGYDEAGPSRGNREAGSEVNDLNHKAGVEPRIGVSSVNRWVRKGGDGKAKERHGFRDDMDPEPRAFPASGGPKTNGDRRVKGKQETRQFGHESKPEDELYPTVISGSKCGLLPANEGPRKKEKMGGRCAKTNQETRQFGHESKPDYELDPTVISGPKCDVFPANEGPRKNGKMGDRQAKGKQKTRQFGHGSKPDDELDLAFINEPKCEVSAANGGPRKNGKMADRREKWKQEARQYGHESKPEDELDPTVVSEPNCGVLQTNGGPRKNGKMVERQAKGKQETRQLGHESKPEDGLDLTVVSEPNGRVFPANEGPSKNGKMGDRRAKGKQETRQFGHGSKPEDEFNPMVVSKPNCGVLPANGGPRKNGKMGDRLAKGKQETRQFGHGSKPEDESDLTVVSELNCGVLPANGGPSKNGKMGDRRAKGKEEMRQFGHESKPEDKLNPSVVSEPRRSGGKNEARQGAGAEKKVERNGSDRKSDIRLELGNLSLDEGSSEMSKRSRETQQVSRERKPESNSTGKSERAELLSGHCRRVRIDNSESQENGEKEASQDAIVETRVENKKVDIELELKALPLNGDRKIGKKSHRKMKKKTEWKPECHELDQIPESKHEAVVFSVHGGSSQGTRAESMVIKNPEREQPRPKGNELQQADSAQKVETLSFDAGRVNGKKEVRRGTRDETSTEIINKEEQRDNFGPELRTLSVNDGSVKNGEWVYKWAEKNPEAGETSGEAEVGVSSINGGFTRHGKRESRGGFRRTRGTRTYRESKNKGFIRLNEKIGGMAWVKKE